MADGVNKVILIGHLGQDPELRYTGSGTAVCNMRLATTETWTDDSGEQKEQTEWHTVTAWGRMGEVCNEYLEKGSKVYFEGKLQTRSWEDRDENTRYSTEVKAREFRFLDSKGGGGTGSAPPQGQSQPQQQPAGGEEEETFEPDDELPF